MLEGQRGLVVMAFDYGEARIGVAVGETLTGSSRPLTTVRARQGAPDWSAIRRIIAEYAPEQLVVGSPTNMDGSPGQMSDRVARFSRQLAERYQRPVDLHDERLSSWEAESRRAVGDRTRHLDAQAAQIVLDSWLNEREKATAS
jgi:putative Holliday junction resolvase